MGRALVDVRVLQREYLLAISRAMTAELELPEVLRLILKSAVELVAGRAGIVALQDDQEEQLRVAAVYGIPTALVEEFYPLLTDLPSLDGAEQEAELTRRLQKAAASTDLGLKRMIRLPMVMGGQVVGVIYVFLAGQGPGNYIREDTIALLRAFAEQAAIAVRNARLYQQIYQEKQRMDAIIEQSADGVMILGPDLRIKEFNKALSLMTGWRSEETVGRCHQEIFTWQKLRTDMDLETARTSGWPFPGAAHLYVEGDLQRLYDEHDPMAVGGMVSLGITYAPLMDENGRMTDIIAGVRDLTRYREEEELQKTFISVVSHELKTPVSIIKGYAGTLRREDAHWSPEVIDESLTVIEEEADNLTNLINSLLEVSRLQAGNFNLEISDDVMLPRIMERVVQRFQTQTDDHTFAIHFPEDFPPIWGDERRLTQVMNNLISNAIKYSPEGGEIVIRGEVHPRHVTILVRDSGLGIAEQDQHKIFQKFSRLDNALSRKTEGTGLGLYLTKAIIEAHNGRIWFHNNPDGPGTTFTLSLPRDE